MAPSTPLSFTGGAAGPSGAYGAPVTVGGLTVTKQLAPDWAWLMIGIIGLVWIAKR